MGVFIHEIRVALGASAYGNQVLDYVSVSGLDGVAHHEEDFGVEAFDAELEHHGADALVQDLEVEERVLDLLLPVLFSVALGLHASGGVVGVLFIVIFEVAVALVVQGAGSLDLARLALIVFGILVAGALLVSLAVALLIIVGFITALVGALFGVVCIEALVILVRALLLVKVIFPCLAF